MPLVFLEKEHGLSRTAAEEYDAVVSLLTKEGLDSPFLAIPDPSRAATILS